MSDTPRTDGMEPYGPPYNETPVIHVPQAFAELLAEHVPGVSDQDCKALAVFEKLKGVKP